MSKEQIELFSPEVHKENMINFANLLEEKIKNTNESFVKLSIAEVESIIDYTRKASDLYEKEEDA